MKGRRRPAAIVLVLLLLGAWFWLRSTGPVGREVAYDLGARHDEVTALTVRYRQGGHLVRESAWRFDPGEAPRRVSHEVSLPPTELTLEARVARGGETREITRAFDAQVEGRRVVHLGDG